MLSFFRRWMGRTEATETQTDSPYPYVYVEVDGTARELRIEERAYLETEFEGGDGDRPYLESKYDQRDGWGRISGYMQRSKLPHGVSILPAPPEDPYKMTREEMIAWLRRKGLDATEAADAPFTTSGLGRDQEDAGVNEQVMRKVRTRASRSAFFVKRRRSGPTRTARLG